MQGHEPVLLREILQSFKDVSLQIFVDGTIGAGGHAAAILENHPEIERYIGFDQDPTALQMAQNKTLPWKDKITLIHSNFDSFNVQLEKLGITKIDGMMLDLGVSSMQLDTPERGFSFSKEGPLDMRMNPEAELTAADIVNHWSEREIGLLFRDSGEVKQWRRAARALVKARENRPIVTTTQLTNILYPILFDRKKNIHPLTLVFQALRICVNQEIERLEKILPVAIDYLNPKGRLAIISFHSLEDRAVKQAFNYAASDKESTSGRAGMFLSKEQQVTLITKKPIAPTDQECESNPRSRSSKLRVIEKR